MQLYPIENYMGIILSKMNIFSIQPISWFFYMWSLKKSLLRCPHNQVLFFLYTSNLIFLLCRMQIRPLLVDACHNLDHSVRNPFSNPKIIIHPFPRTLKHHPPFGFSSSDLLFPLLLFTIFPIHFIIDHLSPFPSPPSPSPNILFWILPRFFISSPPPFSLLLILWLSSLVTVFKELNYGSQLSAYTHL